VVHWESRTLIRFFNFGFKRHSILFGFIGWCRDELLWLERKCGNGSLTSLLTIGLFII
jgi:hypothetical protein